MYFNSTEGAFEEIVKSYAPDFEDDEFIETSKKLTTLLYSAQNNNRKIPDGAVFIIQGYIGYPSRSCLIVIKAETRSGFKLDIGNDVSQVEYIERLFLTPHEKLYKVALVIDSQVTLEELKECSEDLEYDTTDAKVFIYDSNTNTSANTPGAKYFYKDFMGCNFQKNNAIQTQQFYKSTIAHINNYYQDDVEKRLDFISALRTYLKVGTDKVISMTKFAELNISDAKEKDAYFSHMRKTGAPTESIYKDLKRLNNVLKTRRLNFPNSVKLTAPQESFDENIKILNESLKGYQKHEYVTIEEILKILNYEDNTILQIKGLPNREE